MKVFIWLLIALLSVGVLRAADPVASGYASSVSAYESIATAAQKTDFLVGLVNSDSANLHGAFYEILRVAKEDEVRYFKAALSQAKSAAVLLSLGAYLESLKAPFVAEFKLNPKMSLLEVKELEQKADKAISPFKFNLERIEPEIGVVAKRDPQVLITALKKVFTDDEATDSDMVGPVLGIASMREVGATLVLKALSQGDEAKGALSVMSKTLGPYMVIPAIKQYENPASSSEEKETAGLAIFMLPDIEPVYDKVVEAYRHGRYFERPEMNKDQDEETVLDLKDVMAMAMSWWGNTIKGKYQDVEGFVTYVAEKHLVKTEGQGKIIELLADINFGEVAPYLLKMDITELSDESIDAILLGCYVSNMPKSMSEIGGIRKKKEYTVEKFKVYEYAFKSLDKDVRAEKKMIYGLNYYLARDQIKFVVSNVGILTEDEKTAIAFTSGSSDGLLGKPLEASEKKAILDALKRGASESLLLTIKYAEEK